MADKGRKELRFLESSFDDMMGFPKKVIQRMGRQLNRVQQGEDPTDWKPMSVVGSGVREIRVKLGKAYRVMYVAKYEEAVYVLHAFEKKTQKTKGGEIDVARKRFKKLNQQRRKVS